MGEKKTSLLLSPTALPHRSTTYFRGAVLSDAPLRKNLHVDARAEERIGGGSQLCHATYRKQLVVTVLKPCAVECIRPMVHRRMKQRAATAC